MKAALAERTRKMFRTLMRELHPSFNEVHGLEIPAGCRVYACRSSCTLAMFVALTVSPKSDKFTIEVAWSEKGEYPAKWGGISLPEDEPRNGEMRFRLFRLWASDSRDDLWWSLEAKHSTGHPSINGMLGSVEECVRDAISKIQTYAIPYFRRIASQHDCTLPS